MENFEENDRLKGIEDALKNLIETGEKMRLAQKQYFKNKTKLNLDLAKKYEYLFDEKIKNLKTEIGRNENQLSLFKL